MRSFSIADRLIEEFDNGLKTLLFVPVASRPSPAAHLAEPLLSTNQRKRSARLMRVNHSGEICAQALYRGQAWSGSTTDQQRALRQAACEENDHLAWTAERVQQLGGRRSVLNPLWYLGSFTIGAIAGRLGQRWGLGFIAETEHQVSRHLSRHLNQLPEHDLPSRRILSQMQQEELGHAATAESRGAARLPLGVRIAMQATAKMMTRSSYWL